VGTIVNAVELYNKAAPTAKVNWLTAGRFQWDSATHRLGIDLTMDGTGGTNGTKLANGRYEIRISIAMVTDLSGNPMVDGDGLVDGKLRIDRSTGAARQDFFRLAGDLDGDADTDLSDLSVLAGAYQTSAAGDCDGDSDTDLNDLSMVASAYGIALPESFSPAIVITRGGTYSGEWESNDPDIPPVTIRTAEPVVIQNSTLRGKDDLIATDITGADITVRRTRGYGLNPNVLGEEPGRFLKAERFKNVVVENNYLEGTSGIYLFDYRGSGSAAETVRVVGNRALNIDGRKSDGNGGFLDFNQRIRKSDGLEEEGFKRVQFLQLNKVQDVAGIEIAWNEVINQPGKSRVEDNISIYRSGGTAQSPIRIHDNYIHGAYTIKPWQNDTADSTWNYDWDYSGGGIMLGDGDGSAYVKTYNNQVISTTNYGIAIYAGHDMEFYDNRVLSSGKLPDGRTIAAQNVGVYIWDGRDGGADEFYNNSGRDNRIGWINDEGDRNDWWIPDATSFTNNTSWPGQLTLQTEAAEWTAWQQKVAAAGMTVGP